MIFQAVHNVKLRLASGVDMTAGKVQKLEQMTGAN